MKNWFEILNKKSDTAEINIYDEIGLWGITAKHFSDEFKEIEAENIDVHISSPGGSVVDGQAIHTILLNSKKNITVYVDGMALSIASVIALAGKTVIMPENALFMMHNPSFVTWGESKDLRRDADLLDKIQGQIAGIYSAKSGKDLDEIKSLMDAETWYTGKEAFEEGFADKTVEPLKAAAKVDISKFNYKNAGRYNELKNLSNVIPTNAKPIDTNHAVIKPTDTNSITQKEDSIMNLVELKDKHPEIYNAAKAEGATEAATPNQEALNAATAAGATVENKRVEDIKSLAGIKGTETIIENALKDPKATKESVALELHAFNKAAAEKANGDSAADGQELNTSINGLDTGSPDNAGVDADTKAKNENVKNMVAGMNSKVK